MKHAVNSEIILYKYNNKIIINAYALFCDVLDGIKKIHAFIEEQKNEEKMNLSIKLLMRKKMDEEESEDAKINIESLPDLCIISTTTTTTGL